MIIYLGINNIVKSSSSKTNEIPNIIKSDNLEKDVVESNKSSKNIITTDTIGSPTLTDGIN